MINAFKTRCFLGATTIGFAVPLGPAFADSSSLILMMGISDLVDATESVQEGFLVTVPVFLEDFLLMTVPVVSSGKEAWSISVAFPSSASTSAAVAAADA